MYWKSFLKAKSDEKLDKNYFSFVQPVCPILGAQKMFNNISNFAFTLKLKIKTLPRAHGQIRRFFGIRLLNKYRHQCVHFRKSLHPSITVHCSVHDNFAFYSLQYRSILLCVLVQQFFSTLKLFSFSSKLFSVLLLDSGSERGRQLGMIAKLFSVLLLDSGSERGDS